MQIRVKYFKTYTNDPRRGIFIKVLGGWAKSKPHNLELKIIYMKIKAGIIGGAGYTAGELIRILLQIIQGTIRYSGWHI